MSALPVSALGSTFKLHTYRILAFLNTNKIENIAEQILYIDSLLRNPALPFRAFMLAIRTAKPNQIYLHTYLWYTQILWYNRYWKQICQRCCMWRYRILHLYRLTCFRRDMRSLRFAGHISAAYWISLLNAVFKVIIIKPWLVNLILNWF